MSRIYLNIPDIDLKDQFRSYLDQEYIPYLKKRNRLQDKYKRYRYNKSKGIDKFLEDNSGLNYKRLLLLIDDLYHQMHNYKSEYNNNINYEIPFLNRPEIIQSKYLSKNYRMLYIEFCEHADIIQCDELYWSIDDDRAGAKSLGYRIHPRLYALDVDWNRMRLSKIPEYIKEYYLGKNKSNKFENYPELVLQIKNMNEGFTLDDSNLNGEHEKGIEAYDKYKASRNNFTLSGYGNRIYTAESGMYKNLRPYLYHKEHEEIDNYKLVEISNCHLYTLSILILRQRLGLINDQHINKGLPLRKKHVEEELNLFNGFAKGLQDLCKDEDKKAVIVNRLVKCIGVPEFFLPRFYWDVTKEHSIKYGQKLKKLFEGEDAEYFLFMLLACSGLAYDVLAQKMGIPRKQFKKLYSEGMNLKSEHFYLKTNDAVKFLSKQFPNVYDFVLELKNRSYKNYYHQNCKIESKIMINNISEYLLNEGLPFVNLHDGIIVPEKAVNNVTSQLESIDEYALHIPFRVEDL